MTKRLVLMAAVLLTAFSLNAQNKSAGINFSLWKGISTQPADTTQVTYLNLGVLSIMNKLHGVSINIIASTVKNNTYGVQVSGIANLSGNNMKGVQIAGITNLTGNNMVGIAASGLVNIAGDQSKGILISGLGNITGDESKGIQLSGLLNMAGDQFSGIHVSGLANVVGGDLKGVGISGLSNVAGDNMNGIQVAGLLNVTGENAEGIQIAGLVNVAGGKSSGLQLSTANLANELKGVQIGLYNFYRKKSTGFQLGLVNANPNTRIQLMLFGGNATKINIAARIKNQLYYTILGAGTHYLDFSDKFSASAFYRAGLELPLYKKLYISGDLGFQHIELFNNENENTPARLYGLQARVNLEYKLSKRLGLFVTGGYGGSRYYNKSKTYDKGVIAEAGIILL
jgi:hypothetical protein